MKLAILVILGGIGGMAVPALADDLCSTATAAVTIADLAVGESSIDAKGTWQAGGGAAGILLEYRIDSDRMQIESQSGASGSWEIARMEPNDGRCGRHTLRVYVYPSVQDGARQLHCLARGSSAPRQFEISCAPIAEIVDCQWECTGGDSPQCTGICSASARKGRLGYVPFWGVNGVGWQQGGGEPSGGPWTHPVACAVGQRISFKVRDRDGRGLWSEVDEIGCGVTE
jgi:hypothetical protein